jgi:hypothetical protein
MRWRRRARRNVARGRRYPRDVRATAASAFPSETSVAKVPNAPDGQIPLALWPGQDPNLHKLGIYKFEIEATQLNQALRAAVFPRRRSPYLIIEASSSALKIISVTKDRSFVISSSVSLRQQAEIGYARIRFEVKRRIIPIALSFDLCPFSRSN